MGLKAGSKVNMGIAGQGQGLLWCAPDLVFEPTTASRRRNVTWMRCVDQFAHRIVDFIKIVLATVSQCF